MVFESIVVELMNRYLGEYIENLDSSQLKLSIWSGDVVLKNLHIKGDALKDLNLPVQIKFGHVGQLTLKIPWKNLYKEAVEASLDGLYLLAVPNSEVEYDAEKEEKREQEAKQAQLQAIEDQQLKSKKGAPDEKNDGFVEKLATQVIKNLQIHIKNIHVRYEDKVTMVENPFALGVTLHALSFETTNDKWLPCLLDETVKVIFKMIDLKCLAVYWNPKPQKFLSNSTREEQLSYFKNTIASPSQIPNDFDFLVKPIMMQVRLRLNPHPESDLSTPKIQLSVALQDFGLRMLHIQYHSLMELAESMDRMSVNAPFRKFKPNVPIKGNASKWWKYAYKSLLSTGVIVSPGKWSWSNIKEHRIKVKEYKKLYKEKLQQKKPSQKLNDQLRGIEDNLDVFNITLARQTSELELVKAGRQIKSKESVHQPKSEASQGGGWLGGWFGKKKQPAKSEEPPKTGLDAVMSEKEKEDMYQAIGYSENEKITDMSGFDKSYVGLELKVELNRVFVELSNADSDILSLSLINVCSSITQRPSADGLGVTAHLSSLVVKGVSEGDFVPCIVSSNVGTNIDESADKQHLLTVLFEKHPLDGTCDQRIVVDSQPLQIVYDATTINSLLEFVKPPANVRLQQLRTVAASAYDDIKEQTATGLQHIMDNRSVIEIGITLASSYVIIPHGGVYRDDVDCLVLDLGQLTFETANEARTPLMMKPNKGKFDWMKPVEVDETLVLKEMREKAYENYKIRLRNTQILFAKKGQNWLESRDLERSPMHILEPLTIKVDLQKCIVTNDASLPKIKINGEIPSLKIRLSDMRLLEVLELANSIPLPEPTKEEKKVEMEVIESWSADSSRSHLKVLNSTLAVENKGSVDSIASSKISSGTDDEFFTASECLTDSDPELIARKKKNLIPPAKRADVQMTDLKLSFAIKEMVAVILEESSDHTSREITALRIGTLAMNVCVRTWDLSVGVVLQSISVQLMKFTTPDGQPLFLVNSKGTAGSEDLLKVTVLQVKKGTPEFDSIHNRTAQKITINFGTLKLAVHAQALLDLADFGKKLSASLPKKTEPIEPPPTDQDESLNVLNRSPSTLSIKAKRASESIISLALNAQLDEINLTVMDSKQIITDLQIQRITSDVTITDDYLKVKANLGDMILTDASSGTLYKKIIYSLGKNDVLSLEMINYNDATTNQEDFENLKKVDTSVLVELGSTRIIFLNKFIQKLVAYGAHFSEYQEAAASAGTAAQEKAVAKAQELADSLQTANPRIKLDVAVAAPTVVIPTNSMSRDAIVADLGVITVRNRFTGSKLQEGFAVSDEMVVSLQNMKVSKCSLSEELNAISDIRILEEVSLKVEIVRNLSTSWYHDIPDVSVKGHLPPIKIRLSQPDLISIMSLLDGNLKEGETIEKKEMRKEVSKTPSRTSKSSTDSQKVVKTEVKSVEKVWQTLKVDFQMDEVSVCLFLDADRQVALSHLQFLRLIADVSMHNDQSMKVDVAFGELLLEDLRAASTGGITKLIRNKFETKDNNLVTAKIHTTSNGATKIDASISSISIIISVEFLVLLADFFTSALPASESKPEEELTTDDEVPAVKASATTETESPSVEKSKSVTVTLKLHEPEIILVTNVKSRDADAILFGMELTLQYDMVPDGTRQMVSASISNLHIDGCPFKHIFNKADSSLTHKKILAPCKIDLAGLMTDTKQNFNVTLSDIRLKASPSLINTISDALSQLTPPPKEEKEEVVIKHKPLPIWTPLKIKNMNLWFMKDSIVESLVDLVEVDGPEPVKKDELAQVRLPMLQIILESGVDFHTVPLLIAEMAIKGHVTNWSSGEMSGEVELTLGVAYFNDVHSVWEPLIEPIEVDPTALKPKYEPWKLTTRLQQSKKKREEEDNADLPPLMSINIESQHILQTTVSNAALKVLKELGIAFKDAALSKEFKIKSRKRMKKSAAVAEAHDSGAAVIVRNSTGYDLSVELSHVFRLVQDKPKSGSGYLLENDGSLLLDYQDLGNSNLLSILSHNSNTSMRDMSYFYLQLAGGNMCCVNVSQACATLYTLTSQSQTVSFVVDVTTFAGIRRVLLRSHVVICNKLAVDIEVLKTESGDADSKLGLLSRDGQFSLSTKMVSKNAVKLKPKTESKTMDGTILSWKEAIETGKSGYHVENYMKFAPASGSGNPIHFCVEFTEKDLKRDSAAKAELRDLKIFLRPSVFFINYLPVAVKLSTSTDKYEGSSKVVESGRQIQVLDADVSRSTLKAELTYNDIKWIATYQLSSHDPQQLSAWVFTNAENSSKTLTLAKHREMIDGVVHVTLYSPYWMINKTGFTLSYKASDANNEQAVQHLKKGQDIVFFSYTSKSFLSKNKTQISVCNSSFSDSFSLDTVGSSGTITCKTKNFNYMIGMQISLTSFSLSKMITFTSYYSFHNKSDFDIEISELDQRWIEIKKGEKINFWPEKSERFLNARIKDVEGSESVKFRYDQLDSGVLVRAKDRALFVEVSVTEMSVEISVRNYFEGSTALLIVNETSAMNLECWQGKKESPSPILAGEAYHVVWKEPTENRVITWLTSSGKEMTMNAFDEQYSSFIISETHRTTRAGNFSRSLRGRKNPNETEVFYVLFGDGLQRVLLFTEDMQRAKVVEAQIRLERADFEATLSLQGFACSLTDSTARREVASLFITSSGLVWEEKPNKRWKPLAVKYSQKLEESYQRQVKGAAPDENLTLDKYSFNLKSMRVTSPHEKPLQRSFTSGLWFQFTNTPNQMTIHAKVNRLQVDNQLPGAVFPVVLHPVPLPKSIAVDSSPKPFLEVSIMQRHFEQQSFALIKYFKILIQEFSVKLDMGFINGLLPVFGAEHLQSTPEQNLKYFKKDVSLTKQSDDDTESSSVSVNFFDILHLSPIKVHISFSMQNSLKSSESSGGAEVIKMPFTALTAVLQSVGVTLSDIDDVVFKLGYFERKYQFFSGPQLVRAVGVHYVGQTLKQLYVLVFGLDVIGNPYGLVMGIAGGVTDLFYEPYQGIIQGPGEFFEGLGLGALSLLGHTVGGAAGAVSKVTGALGKGVASITMDDDFKRKRLEEKNKQPADLKEGLARGGKGFVMGVFSGVTGVVTKPIEGAKKEGAAGFFKGFGKGLIGVVARPVSGVIDLASNTFEGIQKVADMSEDVKKIRPARWIDPQSGIIQPYSLKRAQGAAILQELEEGRFAETNIYVDHVPLKQDRKSIFMFTNKMLLTAHTGEILGNWKCDWKCQYSELTNPPQVTGNNVRFFFKPPLETQNSGLFSSRTPGPSAQTSTQPLQKVFSPFTRALSFGASKTSNPFSMFSRAPAGSGKAPQSVRYQASAESKASIEDEQKTRSIFRHGNNDYTVAFLSSKYAEYAVHELARLQKKSPKSSVSSAGTGGSNDS